jgi:hypothetical protein
MGGMRKNMTVVYMLEWDNAKEEERFRKYMKLGEKAIPFYKKLQEKGQLKYSYWVDDTEHVIQWMEFEDMDAFGKVWSNKEMRNLSAKMRPLVDNIQYRLLWGSTSEAVQDADKMPRFEP